MNPKVKTIIKHTLIIGLSSSLISLVISLILGEFIVKHIMPQRTYKLAKIESPRVFEEGQNIPFTLQKNLKDAPHLGYTHEYTHVVNTNSHGTRGAEFTDQKGKNTFRILFLGDSMTFGWGVQDYESFPYLVEKYLNDLAKKSNTDIKFEAINAGYADSKTLDSYFVYLKETGLKFDPDLIIVNFFPYNDVADLGEMSWFETDNQGYPLRIVSNKEKIKDGYLVFRSKTEWKYEIPVLRNSHLAILLFNAMEKGAPSLVQKIKNYLTVVDDKYAGKNNETWDCLSSPVKDTCPSFALDEFNKAQFLIKGLANLAKAKDKQFLLTVIPHHQQALSLSKDAKRAIKLTEDEPQKTIDAFAQNQKIDYADLLETLSTSKAKGFFYEQDGHLNAAGTQQVATYLTILIAKKYFPQININPEFYSSLDTNQP